MVYNKKLLGLFATCLSLFSYGQNCASNGAVFEPDNELKALIVFVNFQDGAVNPAFSNSQPLSEWSHTNPNGLPDYVDPVTGDFDKFMYNDPTDFGAYAIGTQEYGNVSNFYNIMSKPKKDFKFMGEVFTNAAGEPTAVTINPTGKTSWFNMNDIVVDAMQAANPSFNSPALDQRSNRTQYTTPSYVPDNRYDFTIFIFRYSPSWANQPIVGMQGWSGSQGGYAGTGLNKEFPLGTGKRIRSGFTIVAGGGLGFETFVHELAHANYSMPHIGGVNGVVGEYFYGQNAYGSTRPHWFFTMNAYERWKMQYISLDAADHGGITYDVNQANVNPAGYLLKDFMQDGDALRIEVPFSGGQHIWIENHKKIVQPFDENVWHHNPGAPTGLNGQVAAGGYMYIEDFSRLSPNHCSPISFSSGNCIKQIYAGGQHDYSHANTYTGTNAWGHRLYEITRGAQNPIGGTSPATMPRLDTRAPFGDLGNDMNMNTPSGNEGLERFFIREEVSPGVFANLYRAAGVYNPAYAAYASKSCYTGGEVINMGTNPTITNYPRFNAGADALNTVYLNGLEVEFEAAGGGDLRVYVRYNEVDVNNNVRWTGNDIELPNITGNSADDLFLTNGKVISLEKNKTPNKRFVDPATSEFVNPTVFTVGDGAKMHLAENAIIHIRDNSTLALNPTGQIVLEDNAQIIIHEGATLHLKGNNIQLNGNNSRIVVHGTIKTDPNVNFSFSGDGYAQFHPTNQLDLGTDSRFSLIGPSQGHRMLELVANTTVHVDGHTIVLNQGKAIYGNNSKLVANGGGMFINYVDFEGANSATALELYDYSSPFFYLRYNNFNGLFRGIHFSNPSGTNGFGNVIENTFNNCTIGMHANNLYSFTTTRNTFNENYFGIYLNGGGRYISIHDQMSQGQDGIHATELENIYLNGTVIENFQKGVYIENTSIYLREMATLKNCGYGIYSSNIDTPTPADKIVVGDYSCAYIIDNTIAGIHGNDITLKIDALEHAAARDPYSLSPTVTPNRFDGNRLIVDVCYNAGNPITGVNARGNYYGHFVPVHHNVDKKNGGGVCYYNLPFYHTPHRDANVCSPTVSGGGAVKDKFITERAMGTEEDQLNSTLNVYPNPTNETVNIQIEGKQSGYLSTLLNDKGQVVWEGTIYNNQTVDVSELASGIYMLQVIDGDQMVLREKIIVQH